MLEIRQSNLKELLKSKEQFLLGIHKPKSFAAAELGTNAHSVILEDVEFASPSDYGKRAMSKNLREELEEAGTLALKESDAKTIRQWNKEWKRPSWINTEVDMRVPWKIKDADVILKGTADMIAYKDDVLYVWDLKTTRDAATFVNDVYKLKYQFQLSFYAWLYCKLNNLDFDKTKLNLRFIALDKSDNKYCGKTVHVFRCKAYRELVYQVLKSLEELEASEFDSANAEKIIKLAENRMFMYQEQRIKKYANGEEML